MLLEGGAAMNLFDTGHHLLTLRPATSIASCWRTDLAACRFAAPDDSLETTARSLGCTFEEKPAVIAVLVQGETAARPTGALAWTTSSVDPCNQARGSASRTI
jgi:hypothetical protein